MAAWSNVQLGEVWKLSTMRQLIVVCTICQIDGDRVALLGGCGGMSHKEVEKKKLVWG